MSLSAVSWALQQQVTPATAKLLLIVLANHSDADNKASPSIDRLEWDCCVSRQTILNATERLINAGLIGTEKRTGGTGGGSETLLYCLKTNDSLNYIPPKPRKVIQKVNNSGGKFRKPTPTEVQEYAKTINFLLDGNDFCDFYESKGWKIGKTPMKSWEAAVRTWKKRHQNEPRKRDFASNLFGDGEMDLGKASGAIWEQVDKSMAGFQDDAYSASGMGLSLEQIPAWTDQASGSRLDGGMAPDTPGTGRAMQASPSEPEDVFLAQTKEPGRS